MVQTLAGRIARQDDGSGHVAPIGTIVAYIPGYYTGGGNSGSVTLNVGAGALIDVAADTVSVDLSELADGTGAIVPTVDEIVYLDASSQKRKLFSEIFGCIALLCCAILAQELLL